MRRGQKPGKAWPCSVARGSIARDEALAQVRIVDHSLNHADARPVVGLLQLRVGQRHVHGFVQVVLVIVGGSLPQFGIRAGESVIRVFGFRGSIYLKQQSLPPSCLCLLRSRPAGKSSAMTKNNWWRILRRKVQPLAIIPARQISSVLLPAQRREGSDPS